MYKPKTANNMKKTVNKYEFTDTMTLNGFSRSGSLALFNWLEELEEDTQEQIEFDPIALRCDFTEYKNLEEIAHDYGNEYNDIDYLEQTTTVIEFDGGIIIQQF